MLDHQLDTAFIEIKALDSGPDWGRFTGIASTDSEDLMGDVVKAGAFEPINVPRVALLFNHDGGAPIGKWEELRQDGCKLIAKGALMLSLEKGRESYAMLKAGILNGLSVGYRPDPNGVKFDPGTGRRTISKGKLLEISLCSVPANTGCRVTETLAYQTSGHDLAERIARMDALWSKDISSAHVRLAEILDGYADKLAAHVQAGTITQEAARKAIAEAAAVIR